MVNNVDGRYRRTSGFYNPTLGSRPITISAGGTGVSSDELECARQGGTWDPVNKVCLLPTPVAGNGTAAAPVTPATPAPNPGKEIWDQKFASETAVREANARVKDGNPYHTVTQAGIYDDPVLAEAAELNAGYARLGDLEGNKDLIVTGGPTAQDRINAAKADLRLEDKANEADKGIVEKIFDAVINSSFIGTAVALLTGNTVEDQRIIAKMRENAYEEALRYTNDASVASAVADEAAAATNGVITTAGETGASISNVASKTGLGGNNGYVDRSGGAGQDEGVLNWVFGTGRWEPDDPTNVYHNQQYDSDNPGYGQANESGLGRDFNYDRFGNRRTTIPANIASGNFYWNATTGAWTDKKTGLPIGGGLVEKESIWKKNKDGDGGTGGGGNDDGPPIVPVVVDDGAGGGGGGGGGSTPTSTPQQDQRDRDYVHSIPVAPTWDPKQAAADLGSVQQPDGSYDISSWYKPDNDGGKIVQRNNGGMVGFGQARQVRNPPMRNRGGMIPMQQPNPYATPRNRGGMMPNRPMGYNMGDKVKKIYNEGYTAPGQAYAIAKNMGYNSGGMAGMAMHRMPNGQMMRGPVHRNMGGKMLMGYNKGGDVPMFANDGTMVNHPFDREGEQFDTVKAMLTPGEFVIDADSTHVFEPILKKINDWEPGDSTALGGLLSKKGEKMTITKDLGNGRKMNITSGEDDEMMMSDAEAMLATEGGLLAPEKKQTPVQLNTGGSFSDSIKNSLKNTARDYAKYRYDDFISGLSPRSAATGFDAQRERARRGANQERVGAALAGGINALGRGADATASQLGGAGLRTNSAGSWGPNGYRAASFSQNAPGATDYAGQANAIGQAQQEIGNATAAEAGLLNSIDDAELSQENSLRKENQAQENLIRKEGIDDRQRAEDKAFEKELIADKKAVETAKLEKGKTDTLRLVSDAKKLVKSASVAGDVINGYTSVKQSDVDKVAGDNSWWNWASDIAATAVDSVSSVAKTAAEYAGIKDTAIRRYAASQYPESMRSYIRLEVIGKNMLLPLVASGVLGKTTDSDLEFAGQTLFDPKSASDTWETQLNDIVARVGETEIDEATIKEDVAKDNPDLDIGNKDAATESTDKSLIKGPKFNSGTGGSGADVGLLGTTRNKPAAPDTGGIADTIVDSVGDAGGYVWDLVTGG